MNYICEKIKYKKLISPKKLKKIFKIKKEEEFFVLRSRKTISNIINKKDNRKLIICGPCSIHDIESTIEYARKLNILYKKLIDKIYIVIMIRYEKKINFSEWKGMIYDPYLNGLHDINHGLKVIRNLLIKLIKIKQPIAIDILNPFFYYYFDDVISWASIGSDLINSQISLAFSSNSSIPIGFKNSSDGNIENTLNAIIKYSKINEFIGINESGKSCIIRSPGNINNHIILIGGNFPNYFLQNIYDCKKRMKNSRITTSIMIDCNNGNYYKNYNDQIEVIKSCIKFLKKNNKIIIGLIIKSYINSGNQKFIFPKNKIKYGLSITSPCINLKDTKLFLHNLYESINI